MPDKEPHSHQRKTCPLFLAALMIYPGRGLQESNKSLRYVMECSEESCQWWDAGVNNCVVHNVSRLSKVVTWADVIPNNAMCVKGGKKG